MDDFDLDPERTYWNEFIGYDPRPQVPIISSSDDPEYASLVDTDTDSDDDGGGISDATSNGHRENQGAYRENQGWFSDSDSDNDFDLDLIPNQQQRNNNL